MRANSRDAFPWGERITGTLAGESEALIAAAKVLVKLRHDRKV